MSYRVVLHGRAEDELLEIANGIANRAPAAAQRWYESMIAAIESLREMPERCEVIPEGKKLPLIVRHLLHG